MLQEGKIDIMHMPESKTVEMMIEDQDLARIGPSKWRSVRLGDLN